MKPCFGTPRSDDNFLDISLPRRCMRVEKSEDWLATGLSKRIRIKKYTGLIIHTNDNCQRFVQASNDLHRTKVFSSVKWANTLGLARCLWLLLGDVEWNTHKIRISVGEPMFLLVYVWFFFFSFLLNSLLFTCWLFLPNLAFIVFWSHMRSIK